MLDRQERNHSLDIYKGVCILLVILTHFNWTASERLKYLFPFWVNMAVPMFMIISGYVYSLSFEKHKINTIGKAYSLNNVLNKIIRYTIPFLIIFVIEIVIRSIEKGHILEPGNIFYIFLQGGYGPGAYYYPFLLQFIFVFPVIFFIIKKFDFKGLILCAVLNLLYEILKNAYYVNENCYRSLVLRYILVIAFGCYLAIGKKRIKWPVYLSCFLIGTAYIIVFKYFEITPKFTQWWTGTSFWASMFIFPIAAFLISKNIKFKPLEIIGKASYNIFLVQMLYFWCCADIIYGWFSSANTFLLLLINAVFCVTVGIVFYYIETPITKLITRKSSLILKKQKTKK